MKCMKCNSSLTESGYCPKCGYNISHLIKSKNTAGWYYNLALQKAKNRELSEASALLEIALSFDKDHIDARNLLGLIYHEMGQVARAMHQWVISINIDIEDNIAVEYLQQYQEDEYAMQKADRGVNLYNQTLYSARLGKEGMALLKIEECCFVAPNFVDAHLLRILLYMNKGDWEQAKKAIKDVLKIDRHNATALRYLREIPNYDAEEQYKEAIEVLVDGSKKEEKLKQLERLKKLEQLEREEARRIEERKAARKEEVWEEDTTKGKSQSTTSKETAGEVKREEKGRKGGGYAKMVVGLIAGVAMGIIVMWAMLVPKNQPFDKQLEYVKNQISQSGGEGASTQEGEETTSTESSDKKKAKVSDYAGKGDKKGIMDYMVIAMGHYKDGNAVKAAKALVKVDEDLLVSDSSKDKYDEIKKSTFGEATTQLYKSGKEAYDEQEYEEAIEDLELAYKIDSSNVEAYYCLGLSYQAFGEKEKAKKVYEEINNKFKGSDREHDAKDRLEEMGY